MKKALRWLFITIIPKNHLSFLFGWLMSIRLPQPFALFIVGFYAKTFFINEKEAEKGLTQYHSLQEFFTRRLKHGVRPLGDGVIVPCDGTQTTSGRIFDGCLIQAKNKAYTVEELSFEQQAPIIFSEGYYFTYYLSPRDYHRVHMPLKGKITAVSHIPGHLWPVNEVSTGLIRRLFCINERVVIHILTPQGMVYLVMVGATNVGKITLSFDSQIITNSLPRKTKAYRIDYPQPIELNKGDELGVFNLGSTVVVLYSKDFNFSNEAIQYRGPLKMGQSVERVL